MASIKDLYDKSEFSKFPQGTKLDKTPINKDGGLDLSADEKKLEKARGYKLGANTTGGKGYTAGKKYSESELS
tara:strand:- start:121 stop:339 length:219 start_codon:yes stop_codon:yes gene_type:complete